MVSVWSVSLFSDSYAKCDPKCLWCTGLVSKNGSFEKLWVVNLNFLGNFLLNFVAIFKMFLFIQFWNMFVNEYAYIINNWKHMYSKILKKKKKKELQTHNWKYEYSILILIPGLVVAVIVYCAILHFVLHLIYVHPFCWEFLLDVNMKLCSNLLVNIRSIQNT